MNRINTACFSVLTEREDLREFSGPALRFCRLGKIICRASGEAFIFYRMGKVSAVKASPIL